MKCSAVCFAIFLSLALCSCVFGDNGAGRLAEKLFSNYMAEVDYTLAVNGESVSGSARINKGLTTRIDILSPDPYAGMSIESDASGAPSIISFHYSGMSVEFTPDAFSKINLAFILLSPEIPVMLERLKGEKTQAVSESFTLAGLSKIDPVKLSFDREGDVLSFIYDETTGTPLVMSVETGDMTLTAAITKIKFEDAAA